MTRLSDALNYRKDAGSSKQDKEGGGMSKGWLKLPQRLSRTSSNSSNAEAHPAQEAQQQPPAKEKKRPPPLLLVEKHVQRMQGRLERSQSDKGLRHRNESSNITSRIFRANSSSGHANTIANKRQESFSEKVLGKLSSLATRKPSTAPRSPIRRPKAAPAGGAVIRQAAAPVRLLTPKKATGIARPRPANTLDRIRRPSVASSHSSCESPRGGRCTPRRRAQTPRAAAAPPPRCPPARRPRRA